MFPVLDGPHCGLLIIFINTIRLGGFFIVFYDKKKPVVYSTTGATDEIYDSIKPASNFESSCLGIRIFRGFLIN